MGGLVVILGMSFWPVSPIRQAILNAGALPKNAQVHFDLAKEAAKAYDYELAEKEFSLAGGEVLGARDEVFAEEIIKEEIISWEEKAEKIDTRDVWLKLALLKWQILDGAGAEESWKKAWFIDPNNEKVISVRRLLLP